MQMVTYIKSFLHTVLLLNCKYIVQKLTGNRTLFKKGNTLELSKNLTVYESCIVYYEELSLKNILPI